MSIANPQRESNERPSDTSTSRRKKKKHAHREALKHGSRTAGSRGAASVAPRPAEEWMQSFPSEYAQQRKAAGMCWPVVIWLSLIHVVALAAPWTFSWEALGLAVFLHWLTGSIGVCLGYHRLLTHTGFQTYRPVRWVLALLGGLSGEGSALSWTADHRQHHAFSDHDGDPHSPGDGSWWSHMLWLGWTVHGEAQQPHLKRWVPDLLKDRGLQWLDRMFLPSHIAFGFLIGGLGYAYGGWYMAASFVMWGIFVRLVAILHSTWLVNSATHMWGYRNYATSDQSRNLWWVALLSYGEGWHNNHHAYPRMAMHGHRWWEIDMTYRAIQVLQLCGLAWDVVNYRDHAEKVEAT